ncbi:MAG TPA: SDR family NAD(P)-dependent oxidoreductase [Verrucomicrobiae bacterium]
MNQSKTDQSHVLRGGLCDMVAHGLSRFPGGRRPRVIVPLSGEAGRFLEGMIDGATIGEDADGSEDALCVYSSLERPWADPPAVYPPSVRRHGLVVLQGHGPGLPSADEFLLAMSQAGLFPKPQYFRKYPDATLNWFESRPYRIRQARLADLPALLDLEQACWAEPLRASADELRQRIERFAEGQLALVMDGKVVGSMYSQRINDTAPLYGAHFRGVHSLHTPGGAIAQFITINVLPEAQHLGLGDQLLEFMLQYSALRRGIKRAVAVSLCKDYVLHPSLSIEEYLHRRDGAGLILDPILRFHESHGARVEGPVPGYRPEDIGNKGHGILVSYDLHNRTRQSNSPAETAIIDPEPIVQECVLAVLGEARQAAFAWKMSLMDMGLTSVDLLDLRRMLSRRTGLELDSTLFFQYGSPEALAGYLRGAPQPAAADASPLEEPVMSQAPQKAEPPKDLSPDPAAIVGMACRFPGGVTNPEQYWSLLRGGKDAIVEVPKDRWDARQYFDGGKRQRGKIGNKFGGFLDNVDQFDSELFRVSPREAKSMDPQQRILLEETWTALERAGIAPDSLAGTQTGVFIGVFTHDYELLQIKSGAETDFDAYFGTGNSASVAAGRLAYFFGLQGPAVTLDTACSSSLVALHLACQSLRNGESELAIVGGVNLLLTPELSIGFSQARMMAPDGRCKTFDASADGYVRSEGCAVVILKRLSQAQADGDNILAVVRGTAVNQDGASNGLTAPNALAQTAVIKKALAAARVSASEVSYVETHGTGTALGDPVEVKGLEAAYAEGRDPSHPLVIGSVKTQIGHTEAAAGLAGLMKVVLSFQNKFIPPHLHFKKPNPLLALDAIPAIVPKDGMEWPRHPRLAGVSSFGFSGTNAHVILSEAPPRSQPPAAPGRKHYLLTLSARREQALQQLARECMGYSGEPLADVCRASQLGRAHFEHRMAIVAESWDELRERLEAFAPQNPASARKPKIAFLFTGQGSQYAGMGRTLFQTEPVFRAALVQCAELLRGHLSKPLLDVLYPKGLAISPIDETAFTQPCLFALEYALAQLWMSWGIQPSAVLGHSVGEYTAACMAGVFSLEDGLKLIAARGRLMQALPRDGSMAAVLALESVVAPAVAPFAATVSIATYNGPSNLVISGKSADVRSIVASLETAGVKSIPLNVSHAFHSPLMRPMLAEFEKVAHSVRYSAPRIEMVSNVSAAVAGPEVSTPDYWVGHVLEPVRFAGGMEALRRAGCDVFLEAGPKPTLLDMGRRCLPEHAATWLASLRPGQPEGRQMLESLGALYVCGASVDWKAFNQESAGRKAPLPTSPFERKRFWIDLPKRNRSARSSAAPGNRLLGRRQPLAIKEMVFESWLSPENPALLNDHRVFDHSVLPAAYYIGMAFATGKAALKSGDLLLTDMAIGQAMVLAEQGTLAHAILTPNHSGGFDFQVNSRAASDDTDEDAPWLLHASAKISAEAPAALPPTTDLARMRAEFGQELSVESAYRQFKEVRGIEYGPCFQGIEHLWERPGETFGRVRLPALIESEAREFLLHPVLLDASFQVFMLCFPEAAKQDVYLPIGLEKLRVWQQTGQSAWCHAKLRPIENGDREILAGELRVFDDNGSLIFEVTGFSFKRAPREAVLRGLQADWKDCLYEIGWTPKPRAAAETTSDAGRWLIMTDDPKLGRHLAARLKEQDRQPVVVVPGGGYERLPGSEIQLDPAQPAHFDRLLAETGLPWRGVVQLWCSEALGCAGILHSAQAFLRAKTGESPRMFIVTRGAQSTGGEPAEAPLHPATLWGLGRVLSREHPEFGCVRIDLDPGVPADEINALSKELLAPDGEEEIAWRGGTRHVSRLKRHPRGTGAISFDPQSTYLVTGGLGAMGLKLAGWMIEKGAKNLVLAARGEPSVEAQKALQQFKEAGANILTARADAAKQEDMAALLARVDQSMPPLRGIIHAAGVIDEAPLREQTWERCLRVMAPKVDGAWNLHLLTQGRPLDFFVMFSSISSVLGSARLGPYAAANAFMDALAHRRRAAGLPALSVNWGPWAEAGMAARMDEQDKLGMATIGIGQIAIAQGLQAMGELAANGAAQVMFCPVNWNKYLAQFAGGRQPSFFSELAPAMKPPQPPAARQDILEQIRQASNGDRLPALASYLQKLVAGVLRLSPDRVAPSAHFNRMGVDSLMALELRSQIGKDLSVDVPMVKILQNASADSLAALIDTEFSKTAPRRNQEIVSGEL